MNYDLNVLIYSIICGILIGLIYEIFRLIRITIFPFDPGKPKSDPKIFPGSSAEAIIVLSEKNDNEGGLSRIFTAVCDVLFGIIGGICCSVLLFHTNNGEIRWFAMVGCAIGFVAYMLTIGRIILKIYVKTKTIVFKLVKKIVAFALAPIIIPLKALARVLRKVIVKRRAKKTLLKLLKENSKENERDTSQSDNCEGEGAVLTS